MSQSSDNSKVGQATASATEASFSGTAVSDALVVPSATMQAAPGVALLKGSSRPAILSAAPKPIDLLRALQRRWLLATILATCLAIPAALIAYFTVPVSYTSTAWLQTKGGSLIFSVNKGQGSIQTHVQLIRSYFVLNGALSQPGVSELPGVKKQDDAGADTVEWLAKSIGIKAPRGGKGGSSIMHISVVGDDPKETQVLAQAVTDAYLDRVVNEERKGLLKRRELLDQLYRRKSDEIRKKREGIRELAKTIGTSSAETADTQQQMLVDLVLYLRRETSMLRQKIVRAERNRAVFLQRTGYDPKKDKIPQEAIDQFVLSDKVLQKLREKLAQANAELQSIKEIVVNPAASRRVAEKTREVSETKAELEKRYREVYANVQQQIKEGKISTKLGGQYNKLVRQLEDLKIAHQEAESQYLLLSQQIKTLGGFSADLLRRKEDLLHITQATRKIGAELEKLQIELSVEGNRVELIQKPRLPRSANTKKRTKWTWLAAVAGVGLAVLGISLFEFQARRITRAEEMIDGLGMNVMGTVPMLSERRWRFSRNGMPASELQTVMDESVDGVRAMLLHSAEGSSVRTLLVTSAKAGEGKTTVASSLAASLGRSGRRTLLIDGDLRSPSVHRLLEMPLDAGFAEVLRGEASVEEVIHPSRATGLWVMSAGHCDHVSLQSLTKDGLTQVFEKLRAEFDYIIVDTGPILAVVDPLLLGQHCDAAILSIVRRVSQMSTVYEACERLKATGVKIVGCVVNGASSNVFGAGYYGYGYGYGYGSPNGQPQEAATDSAADSEAD